MTLNEITYAIAEPRQGDRPPSPILLEIIKFNVVHYRSLFLRRDYTDNVRFPKAALQVLGDCEDEKKLELELVDANESSILARYNVRRTKRIIPLPVRLKNWQEFYYVGTLDKMNPYTPMVPEEVPYRQTNKYTAKVPGFYYADGRIYVVNTTAKYIRLEYMLSDPRLACDCSDYNDDEPFPIPDDMLSGIITGIQNGELRLQNPPASTTTEVTV